MSKAIEESLKTLIPSSTGHYPTQLVETANLLYVRSLKQVKLKPDEEIARLLLCSHLAVEICRNSGKLRNPDGTQLNLPEPKCTRPPIRPLEYRKLLEIFRMHLAGSPLTSPVKSPVKSPMKSPAKSPSRHSSSPYKKGKTPVSSALIRDLCGECGFTETQLKLVLKQFIAMRTQLKDQLELLMGLLAVVAEHSVPQFDEEDFYATITGAFVSLGIPPVSRDSFLHWFHMIGDLCFGTTWYTNLKREFSGGSGRGGHRGSAVPAILEDELDSRGEVREDSRRGSGGNGDSRIGIRDNGSVSPSPTPQTRRGRQPLELTGTPRLKLSFRNQLGDSQPKLKRRKPISGIGNMIPKSKWYTAPEKVEAYKNWEKHILDLIEQGRTEIV